MTDYLADVKKYDAAADEAVGAHQTVQGQGLQLFAQRIVLVQLPRIGAAGHFHQRGGVVSIVGQADAVLPAVQPLDAQFAHGVVAQLDHNGLDQHLLAAHVQATFWFILPSLPMFLLMLLIRLRQMQFSKPRIRARTKKLLKK